ncbi:hypothetical protein QH637_03555 [Heyndrickxia coagulans]|jgi:hypothetical protein
MITLSFHRLSIQYMHRPGGYTWKIGQGCTGNAWHSPVFAQVSYETARLFSHIFLKKLHLSPAFFQGIGARQ